MTLREAGKKISFEEAVQIQKALEERTFWLLEIGEPGNVLSAANQQLKVIDPILQSRNLSANEMVVLLEPNGPPRGVGDDDYFNIEYRRLFYRDIGIVINNRGVDMPVLRQGRKVSKDEAISALEHQVESLKAEIINRNFPTLAIRY